MTNDLKQRLSNIYELVKNGATDGEKAAAKAALDRIIKKYNIDSLDEEIKYREYAWTIPNYLCERLLITIMTNFTHDALKRTKKRSKIAVSKITHEDYIIIDCMYGYFRKHMMRQWTKHFVPEINKCRKAKTKNAKRKQLQHPFYINYAVLSKLLKPDQYKTVEEEVTEKEKAIYDLVGKVEGGNYTTQVATANTLLITHK